MPGIWTVSRKTATQNNKQQPLPGICGKRFLTTYLTTTGFGAHGNSGYESSKEQLFRSKVFQTERKGFDVSSSSHLGSRCWEF